MTLESLAPHLHAHVCSFLPVESVKQFLLVSTIIGDRQIHPSQAEKLRVHPRTSRSFNALVVYAGGRRSCSLWGVRGALQRWIRRNRGTGGATKEGRYVKYFCGHPITKLKLPGDIEVTQLAELKENGLLDFIIDLDLSDLMISDSYLVHISTLENLHSLNLCGSYITDEGITRLLELSNLVSLNMTYCHTISGEGISHLQGLPNLKHLKLSGCILNQDDDYSLVEALSHLSRLESINLSFAEGVLAEGVLDEGLNHISALWKLKSLDLSSCHEITGKGIQHLSRAESLEELVLSGSISDEWLRSISGLRKLESLELSLCSGITCVGLGYIAASTSIRKLRLSSIGDEDIEALQGMHLLSLDVSSSSITDQSLELISHHLNLESLHLNRCDRMKNEGLRHFSKMTSLKQLELSYCDWIRGEGLVQISHMVNLTSLDLKHCYDMTAENMVSLSGLTKLQCLGLRFCYDVDGTGLQHLSNLLDLKSLDLGLCRYIDDQGLVHLSNLLALETLVLEYCEKISDQGLRHISKLSRLRTLHLSHCNITDAGMKQIARSHEFLEMLRVSGCDKITERGKKFLKRRNLNLKIEGW